MTSGTKKRDTIHHQLTTAEAVQLVKRGERMGHKFYLHVRIDAAVVGDPDKVFQQGLSGSLHLSRADALTLASSMLSPTLEARGARIPVAECDWGDGKVVYWFGG